MDLKYYYRTQAYLDIPGIRLNFENFWAAYNQLKFNLNWCLIGVQSQGKSSLANTLYAVARRMSPPRIIPKTFVAPPVTVQDLKSGQRGVEPSIFDFRPVGHPRNSYYLRIRDTTGRPNYQSLISDLEKNDIEFQNCDCI